MPDYTIKLNSDRTVATIVADAPAEIARLFAETEYTHLFAWGCCDHVSSPGQFELYGNMCPQCGRYGTPRHYNRPESLTPNIDKIEVTLDPVRIKQIRDESKRICNEVFNMPDDEPWVETKEHNK